MLATNIKWDLYGEEEHDVQISSEQLPQKVPIPKHIYKLDEIADYLSDEFGFCNYGFDLEFTKPEERFRIVMTSNIYENPFTIWDVEADRYYADEYGEMPTYATEEEANEAHKNIVKAFVEREEKSKQMKLEQGKRKQNIKRKYNIKKLDFPIDNLYYYNTQVLLSIDGGISYYYCGIGKFCKTKAEAKQYIQDYETKHRDISDNVIPDELTADFGNIKCRQKLIELYGDSDEMYFGKNQNNEMVMLSISKETGIVEKVYQENGWIRVDYYGVDGDFEGQTFDGRYEEPFAPGQHDLTAKEKSALAKYKDKIKSSTDNIQKNNER